MLFKFGEYHRQMYIKMKPEREHSFLTRERTGAIGEPKLEEIGLKHTFYVHQIVDLLCIKNRCSLSSPITSEEKGGRMDQNHIGRKRTHVWRKEMGNREFPRPTNIRKEKKSAGIKPKVHFPHWPRHYYLNCSHKR